MNRRALWFLVAGVVGVGAAMGCANQSTVSTGGGAPATPAATASVPSAAPTPVAATAKVPAIPAGDWVNINRDAGATRYSPLTQINAGNVATLAQRWTFAMGGGASSVPVVVDGVMYLSAGPRVVALDADTGKQVWEFSLNPPAPAVPAAAPAPAPAQAPPAAGGRAGGRGRGGAPQVQASARGVTYWPGDGTLAPRIVFMGGNRMFAIDAATGRPAAGFGTNGSIDVGVPFGAVPTVYRHAAIIGAASGEVPVGPAGNPRAFDLRTGQKLWEFQTVPKKGEKYNDQWGDGWENRGGTNMWGFAAPIDAERGIAYLPIAGPATNYWGGDRPGRNDYANSVVAVDAVSGKYLWHFQTVHHDIWDIDLPSAGALFDFVQNGRRTPAIAHVGKSSYVYVLDRTTGRPLIQVDEKPVPKGDVPGEYYHPTQPIPVRPAPLSRVSFNAATDLVRAEDTTPEHAAACRAMMERAGGFYNVGPFTPFMFKETGAPPKSTIQLPGGTGGVNWGGMAMDPQSGVFYVNAQNTTLVGWVERKPPGVTYSFEAPNSNHPFDRAFINGVGPFHTFQAPLGGKYTEPRPGPNGVVGQPQPIGPQASCLRPPWSKLIAVNANTGTIVWETPLGLNENLPQGKQLAGNSGSAGPTVTAGGLVFVGATNDGRFRAFDAKSGKQVWVTRLPAGATGNATNANANPMSYQGKSGKQYVAVVASPNVVVYALP